jgi:hypothetical protein
MSSLTSSVKLFIENYLCLVVDHEAEVFVDEFETQLEDGKLSHNVKTAIKQIETVGEDDWPIYHILKLYESVDASEW